MEKENELLEAIKSAESLALEVASFGHSQSRANSLSLTNLQTSRLWAEQDIKEKTEKAERAAANESEQ